MGKSASGVDTGRPRRRVLGTILVLAGAAAGCSDAPSGNASSITVYPATFDILEGDTARAVAVYRNSVGVVEAVAGMQWSSSDTAVLTVEPTGKVHATGTGTASVRASVRGVTGEATVTVGPVYLVGAGDIAVCGVGGDEQTAALLDTLPGTVFTTGDNAYQSGTAIEFATCYEPSWGRHRGRTRPAPGNHDYLTAGAAGYFGYFAAAAGPPGLGYYSYDLGGWHLVSLNSEVALGPGSAQYLWLQADLAAHPQRCVLAYWHKPRFSSGANHGNNPGVAPLWDLLYAAGADVVLGGHDHVYERFASQTPAGVADPAAGIREFVVGTGGGTLYAFAAPQPNSEVRYSASYGVLWFRLRARAYDWTYVSTAGVMDSGTDQCH
jgi:calcineurin-like phosphoesterase family protein